MDSLSVPTTSTLSSTQIIPSSHPLVHKALYRLSRPSLLSLILDWLDDRNHESVSPYLVHADEEIDEQEMYPPVTSLPRLREIYTDLQEKKGSKRDVVDRVVEGDFRHGVTLYQLAMADMQYLYDHPLSQKWTALKIARLAEEGDNTSSRPVSIPRFHPSTFLRNLQQEVLPDVKAHFNLDRHSTLPLTILRVFLIESPYNTDAALALQQKHLTDSSRTFYVAFPDASPYVYISISPPITTSSRADNKSLRKLLLDGIPKAFSRPRERYKLESTNLSAKNLEALVERRGPNGTNAAGGGWSVYVEGKKGGGGGNPLNTQLPTPERSVEVVEADKEPETTGLKRPREQEPRVVKRRKIVAQVRFGNTGIAGDGKGIERLDIRMEDPYPLITSTSAEELRNNTSETSKENKKSRRSTVHFEDDEEPRNQRAAWTPDIRLTFHGSHIHAGIRELVEAGVIDGEKMPSWITGEEGVSVGAVRRGKIRGHKGSGIF